MPNYRRVGDVPRKRHTLHRRRRRGCRRGADGRRRGSRDRRALLYHRHSPSAIVRIEPVDAADGCAHAEPAGHARTTCAPASWPRGDRRRCDGRARRCSATTTCASPSRPRRDDRARCTATPSATSSSTCRRARPCSRACSGACRSAPATTSSSPPASTHRWVVDDGPAASCSLIEARGHVTVPAPLPHADRPARSRARRSASATSALPEPEPLLVDGEDVPVLVRTRAGLSRARPRHHPFDVVGWDGCLYPWALSIHDFEPIVGRIHQPPPVHQTFAGPGFVVCSLRAAPVRLRPDAVKVPYHHANVDTDEVLFYCAGDFMSRAGSGIGVGSISVHPAGLRPRARSPAAASAATARTAPRSWR